MMMYEKDDGYKYTFYFFLTKEIIRFYIRIKNYRFNIGFFENKPFFQIGKILTGGQVQ